MPIPAIRILQTQTVRHFGKIEDNVELEIAKAASTLTLKIERLESCLEEFPRRDAVPEALFRLGVAYKADDRPVRSEEVFVRLLREYPSSVWTKQAAHYTPHRAAALRSRGSAG